MNYSTSSLNSRLWIAASLGQLDRVRQLLDAGAEIDSVDSKSQTAAYLAASNGHIDVIRLLAARHANFALADRFGVTPINIAIVSKNAPLVIALIETNTPFSDDLLCAAATVSTDMIQCLLNRGCNIAALRTANQETPCHVAAWRQSDVVTIDMLVTVVGVDVDARDNSGHTCCLVAAANHNAITLRCFIAAGADVDVADSVGDTPSHVACSQATGECVTLLLAAGADVHHRNIAGFTACHKAACNSELALRAVLAVGADFDAPSNDGRTPRQIAKQRNLPEPTSDDLALARRKIAVARLSFVRQRAIEICIGLQSIGLDALCMCEILRHSCGPLARFIPFHIWWQIATAVKHFHE